jgi:tripartite tricarboxylate transporter family receptor
MASYGVIWGRRNARSLAESGYKDFEADLWYGVVAPAKAAREMLSQLAGLFAAALQAPEIKPKLSAQGLYPVGLCAQTSARIFANNTTNTAASFARRTSRRNKRGSSQRHALCGDECRTVMNMSRTEERTEARLRDLEPVGPIVECQRSDRPATALA